MMRTLGISAFTRGAAAALVVDGEPVAAMAEERFTRELGDPRYPERAVRACLRAGEVSAAELDHVVFFEKPLRRFERVLTCELGAFPASLSSFPRLLSHWLGERLWTKGRLVAELGVEPERVLFTTHHQSHAASSFFASPFEEAAVLVVDGAGEWTSTSLARGRGLELEPLAEIQFPHSLVDGLAAFCELLGFAPLGAADAFCDLAAHAEPRRADEVRALLGLRDDGSFELDSSAFTFTSESKSAFGPALEARFGPARSAGSALSLDGGPGSHGELAASVLRALGDALVALARAARERTGSARLCLAGDLASLPDLVDRVARESGFEEVFVPSAPDDGGAALGAALYVQHAVFAAPRAWTQEHAYLGAELATGAEDPPTNGAPTSEPAQLASRLAAGGTLGLAHGAFEWGDTALGRRCALADPGRRDLRDALVQGLRKDEPFRAPTLMVSEDAARTLLDVPPAVERLARFRRVTARPRAGFDDRLRGALRPDGTCLAVVVPRAHEPRLHDLLERFGEHSGVGALLVVPLAQRGEPPARTAAEALAVFERSQLDALDLDGRLYER